MVEMSVTIDMAALDSLASKIDSASLVAPLKAGANWLKEQIEKEPKKAAGAFSRLATPAQRRAFWAKVRSGQAQVDGQGYVRTHKTARGWKVAASGRYVVKLYNDSEGAPYVYRQPPSPSQQPFHAASGWARVDTFAVKYQRGLQAVIDRVVKRARSL